MARRMVEIEVGNIVEVEHKDFPHLVMKVAVEGFLKFNEFKGLVDRMRSKNGEEVSPSLIDEIENTYRRFHREDVIKILASDK